MNGVVDDNTRAALRTWQDETGRQVTGYLDAEAAAVLSAGEAIESDRRALLTFGAWAQGGEGPWPGWKWTDEEFYELFYKTGGPEWNPCVPMAEWDGIEVRDGRVVRMVTHGLMGRTLPSEIVSCLLDDLSALERLHPQDLLDDHAWLKSLVSIRKLRLLADRTAIRASSQMLEFEVIDLLPDEVELLPEIMDELLAGGFLLGEVVKLRDKLRNRRRTRITLKVVDLRDDADIQFLVDSWWDLENLPLMNLYNNCAFVIVRRKTVVLVYCWEVAGE